MDGLWTSRSVVSYLQKKKKSKLCCKNLASESHSVSALLCGSAKNISLSEPPLFYKAHLFMTLGYRWMEIRPLTAAHWLQAPCCDTTPLSILITWGYGLPQGNCPQSQPEGFPAAVATVLSFEAPPQPCQSPLSITCPAVPAHSAQRPQALDNFISKALVMEIIHGAIQNTCINIADKPSSMRRPASAQPPRVAGGKIMPTAVGNSAWPWGSTHGPAGL